MDSKKYSDIVKYFEVIEPEVIKAVRDSATKLGMFIGKTALLTDNLSGTVENPLTRSDVQYVLMMEAIAEINNGYIDAIEKH